MRIFKNISLKHIKHQIDLEHEIRRYIILIFAPMIFCVALYYGMHEITIRQMQENAAVKVDLFVQLSDSILHEAELVDRALVSDFIYLSNSETTEGLAYSYDNPESISRQICIRMEDSAYIEEIFYVSYRMNRIYSSKGYFDIESLPSLASGYGISAEEIEGVEESTWNMIVTQFIRGPYNISPTRNNQGEIDGYLVTILDLDVFVNNVFGLETEYACFFNDQTFISTFSVPENFINEGEIHQADIKNLLGDDIKCFFSEVNGYTYMVGISAEEFYLPFRLMTCFFLLYALIVVVFGLIWLYRISKKRREQLSSIITALDPDNPPGTYQTLIADIKEKLIASRDGSQELENNQRHVVFRDVIHNSYSREEIEKSFSRIEIPVDNKKFFAARFYIRSYNNVTLVSSNNEDTRHLIRTIFDSAMDQFSNENTFSEFYCMDQESFSTLFYGNQDIDFEKDIMALCESINSFLQDEYGIDIHTAISREFTDLVHMKEAFYALDSLEGYAKAIANKSKIISEEIVKKHGDLLLTGDFFKQEQTLLNTLLLKKYDAIPAMIESIVKEHIVNSGIAAAESRLQQISGILVEAICAMESDKLDKQSITNRLQSSTTADKLVEETRSIFSEISKMLESEPIEYPKVDEACEYINNNLSDTNLNVSMICEAVDVIVQRLTPMFQEKMGMGIAEYVNYRRIEQAKRILLTTKLTVKQVGEDVGYANTDTFTRNFRKIENMTPTEYRRLASL